MQRAADRGAMRDDVAFAEHPLELAVAPALTKRVGVQLCDRGCVARVCLRERRLAARKQTRKETLEQPDHRRGSLAASWGWASGARR